MFYHLSLFLTPYFSFFNVVHYVSFRIMAALLTTLLSSFLLFPWFIQYSRCCFRSRVREYTPDRHKEKDNTPTMGGLLMVFLVILNALFWANLWQSQVWIFLLTLSSFAALGAWDDWCKIKYKKGISASKKFIAQWSLAVLIIGLWYGITNPPSPCIPFFKTVQVPMVWWWVLPAGMFILVAMSNAVNLTDGLDGLAVISLIPNFSLYALLCYIAGHTWFSHYLGIPFVPTAEVAILGSTLIGASLGFMWFNAYPAEIFMGDVGALASGAALAMMAIMCRQELLLPISGGLFVVETCSVVLQVLFYKLRRRRLFRMAPIHHHFELLGWQETQITLRFGIISLILCLFALITIKIR